MKSENIVHLYTSAYALLVLKFITLSLRTNIYFNLKEDVKIFSTNLQHKNMDDSFFFFPCSVAFRVCLDVRSMYSLSLHSEVLVKTIPFIRSIFTLFLLTLLTFYTWANALWIDSIETFKKNIDWWWRPPNGEWREIGFMERKIWI